MNKCKDCITIEDGNCKIIEAGNMCIHYNKENLEEEIARRQRKLELEGFKRFVYKSKNDYFEMIEDIGHDYDGFHNTADLKSLIDELVELARKGRRFDDWRSVDDKPVEGVDYDSERGILVIEKDEVYNIVEPRYIYENNNYYRVKYWQPLPEKPKGENQ